MSDNLDARIVPDVTTPCANLRNEPLAIDFLQSTIDNPQAVAGWLKGCFVSHCSISVCAKAHGRYVESCREVHNLLSCSKRDSRLEQ